MRKTLLTLGLLTSFYTLGWCQTDVIYSGSSDLFAYNSTSLCYHTVSKNSDANENLLESADLLGGQGETVSIVFYPNPVKDMLSVRFKEKGNYTIRIYNIVGEKIREKTVFDDFIVKFDDLSSLQNGLYFLSYEPEYGKVITKTFSKGQ